MKARLGLAASLAAAATLARAGDAAGPVPVELFGIPVDFILFALTLLGVAIFHHHVLAVALSGLATIVIYKLTFTGFKTGGGTGGGTGGTNGGDTGVPDGGYGISLAIGALFFGFAHWKTGRSKS